ncbi:MAG: hypothetical protein O4807_01005 [Trichodesmium sp. St19_bin2]|nr:hypothetical protein [Trichodesmium sp. St19_bin2]
MASPYASSSGLILSARVGKHTELVKTIALQLERTNGIIRQQLGR